LLNDPVRCKLVVDNNCLKQVNHFKYLGCEIYYENKKVIKQKLTKLALIFGILYHTFKPTPVQNFSRVKYIFKNKSI